MLDSQEGSADGAEGQSAVPAMAAVRSRDSFEPHKFGVYLNLAHRMKLTGMDQLWVADITAFG